MKWGRAGAGRSYAIACCEKALRGFTRTGDEYWMRGARTNLAKARAELAKLH